MKEFKDIRDDQIRVIGEVEKKRTLSRMGWILISSALGLATLGLIIFLFSSGNDCQRTGKQHIQAIF